MPAKPTYRLKTVLDLRLRAKQDAARLVARRRVELEVAQTELQRRTQAVIDCQQEQLKQQVKLINLMSKGITANRATNYRTHLADLREKQQELEIEVAKQNLAVLRAEAEVEKAVDLLIKATQEAQVIEKHKEGWTENTRRVEEKQQQKLSDEIGAILYERKRN